MFFRSIFCLLILLLTQPAYSQVTGNPLMLEKNSWSVGAGLEFMSNHIKNDGLMYEYTNTRALSKIDFAVNNYIDVALIVGAANLHITYPKSLNLNKFNSKFELVAGGAVKLRLPIQFFGLARPFVEAGGIKLGAIGNTEAKDSDTPGELYLKYNIREFWGTAGIIVNTTLIDYYAAYQGKKMYQTEAFAQDDYTSDVFSQIIAGIDIKMQGNYAINVQARILNGEAISIGVSQYLFWN